jgi:hypothetical protein
MNTNLISLDAYRKQYGVKQWSVLNPSTRKVLGLNTKHTNTLLSNSAILDPSAAKAKADRQHETIKDENKHAMRTGRIR